MSFFNGDNYYQGTKDWFEPEHRACRECGAGFTARWKKHDVCGSCFLKTAAGKQWKAQREARTNPHAKTNWWDNDGPFSQRENPEEPLNFNDQLLRKLIMLCHPDKHNNSKMATEVTQELLKLRKK